jgi:hypothetical protein
LSRHDQHLYPLVAQMQTPTFKRHFFHASFRKIRRVSWLSCQAAALIRYKGTAMNWTTGLTYAMGHKGCILSICKIGNKLCYFLYRLVQTTCKKKVWVALDYMFVSYFVAE